MKRTVMRGEIKTRRTSPPPQRQKMQDGLAVSAGLWARLTVINPQRKLTNETLNSYGWEGGEMPEE